MTRTASLAVLVLWLAGCDNAVTPDVSDVYGSPSLTVVTVPGDFATIQQAHDAASSGDTIIVAPGTHVGQITITKAITLASQFITTGDTSFITSTILDGGGGLFTIEIPATAEDGAVIQGLTIQNSDDGITPRAHFDLLNCRVTNTNDGIDYENGSGGLVQFCLFELNGDDAIDLDNDVDAVIVDNILRNNNDDGIEIRLQSYTGPPLNIIISRNEIHGNGEDGIQLIGYDVPTDRFIEISYNNIYDNVDVGVGMMDGQVTSEDFRAASLTEQIRIFSNTFSNNSHGITGGDSTVVLNNIFVNHAVIAVKNVDGGSELAYNLFFNNGTDNSGSNVDVPSSVFADPLLDANLELQAGSPAINAGTATYVWQGQTVLDLQPADYIGVAPDMGAFEAPSGGGPPPDPPVLTAPADGAVDVSLTPTLMWTGAGDNYNVQVATDTTFTVIIEQALVTTTQHTVSAGALNNATEYAWRVNASDVNGTSEYSSVFTFTTEAATTPPDAPVLNAPANGAVDVAVEPTLVWSGTADDFDVEVATDTGFTAIVFSTNTAADSVTVPPATLNHETEYFWHVRGNNSFGPGALSSTFSFTTEAEPDTIPPSQPQNLMSPSKTSTTVDLVWDPSTDNVGVTHYNIYRDSVMVASESATNHTAVNLSPNTSYDFQVAAVDADGNESAYSAILTVTTDPAPQPGIHVDGINLILRSQGPWNSGRAVVTVVDDLGNPVSGANVDIAWSGLAASTDAGATGSGGDVTFDSDKVSNSQAGEFIITVTNVSLAGFVYDSASNVVSAACVDTTGSPCIVGPPDTDPPAAPTGLVAAPGAGVVSLDWNDNTEPDLASYSVYRSTTSGGGYALVASGVSSSDYIDTGLSGGTTYFYVVTASDLSGNASGFSNEASATPGDAPTVHVEAIDMALLTQGPHFRGEATVTVFDQNGQPVAGVEVQGAWTYNGQPTGSVSGTTDANGQVSLQSAKERASSGDIFEFTVLNLILAGSTYDSASNVETTDSVTVP